MSAYPEPTVGAIILNPEHKILLCKSRKWQNKWVIPGGHIELGESMENALKREVMEETGLAVYDIRFVGLQESIWSDIFHAPRHFVYLDFLCRTLNSEVVLNDEADEWAWVKPDELLSYDLGGYTRQFFTEYLNPEPASQTSIFYQYVRQNEPD